MNYSGQRQGIMENLNFKVNDTITPMTFTTSQENYESNTRVYSTDNHSDKHGIQGFHRSMPYIISKDTSHNNPVLPEEKSITSTKQSFSSTRVNPQFQQQRENDEPFDNTASCDYVSQLQSSNMISKFPKVEVNDWRLEPYTNPFIPPLAISAASRSTATSRSLYGIKSPNQDIDEPSPLENNSWMKSSFNWGKQETPATVDYEGMLHQHIKGLYLS